MSLSIIIAILLILCIIGIHELGHVIGAKATKIKVKKFFLGLPPKCLKLGTDKSGTKYILGRIPLGGRTELKNGDYKHAKDLKEKDGFIGASLQKKLVIILAGSFANILFGCLIFFLGFLVGTKPLFINSENYTSGKEIGYLTTTRTFLQEQGFMTGELLAQPALVKKVIDGFLGQQMGIQSGDVILTINDQDVTSKTITPTLQGFIGQKVNIVFTRDGATETREGQCPPDNCFLGTVISSKDNIQIFPVQFGPGKAASQAIRETKIQAFSVRKGLSRGIKGLVTAKAEEKKKTMQGMVGPLGAIKMSQFIRQGQGIMAFFAFFGMISIGWGIANLLPIPGLDGGRTIGAIIQHIFGAKSKYYFLSGRIIRGCFQILLAILLVRVSIKDIQTFRSM